MATIRRITDEDGEQRREFTLVTTVSFGSGSPEYGPYFQDSELVGLAKDWMRSEFDYHEDSPRVEFITDRLAADLWNWVINANNGLGKDVGDLVIVLERHGLSCPEGLDDD